MERATLGVGLSILFHLAVMGVFHWLFWSRRRRKRLVATSPPPYLPSVTILKPLAGQDDDLEANLDSFAGIEHDDFEILFGVASVSDRALPVARAFLAKHPHVRARIIVTEPDAAINPKVAQLIGLAEAARTEVLVISDSNVRVPPSYLRDLVAPLAESKVGLVTNLFAGTGEKTIGALLENLQLAATITPSVVVSTFALPVPVTVGKSMALRAADIQRLGGFTRFGDVLAEDLMLGRAFAAAGLRVETVFALVENRNVCGSVGRMFDRHTRWAKMRRAICPGFLLVEPLLSPILVAFALCLLAPSRMTLTLLGVASVVQTASAFTAAWHIRGKAMPLRYAPLEVVRTFLLLGCWARSWISRRIVWRGNAFTIGAGSVLERRDAVGRQLGLDRAPRLQDLR